MKNNNYLYKYMEIALEEAKKAEIDVPVGAVLVYKNKIIAKASNRKELDKNPLSHAEILVINKGARLLNSWRLEDTILYVTLEPCPMCASAILYARIPEIVFGAYDNLYGAFGSALSMQNFIKFTPKITGGILEEECSTVLKQFFVDKRAKI